MAMAMAMATASTRKNKISRLKALLLRFRTRSKNSVFRTLAAAALIVGGAAVAFASAAGQVIGSTHPELANKIWPYNGQAAARLADLDAIEVSMAAGLAKLANPANSSPASSSKVQIENEQKWQKLEMNARKSFSLDPLNASALRNLALLAHARGQQSLADNFVKKAVILSRRDTAASTLQLQDAIKSQNLQNILPLLDRILRTSEEARSQYLPVLIAALRQDEGLEFVHNLISKRPNWESQFWSAATHQKNAPEQIGELRVRVLKTRATGKSGSYFNALDSDILDNLILNRHFDAAKSLEDFLEIQSRNMAQSKEAARRSEELERPGSRFIWQWKNGRGIHVFSGVTRGIYDVELDGGVEGAFASRLIKLPRSQISLKILGDPIVGIKLRARLECAETNLPSNLFAIVPNEWNDIQLDATASCKWFNLELIGTNEKLENNVLVIRRLLLSQNEY